MTPEKRILSLFFALIAVLLFCVPFSTSADVADAPSTEEAAAILFTHLESGVTVYAKAENENVGAGSAVKVLSGMLLCKYAEGRRGERVKITKDMLSPAQGRAMGLAENDIISVDALLYAAICGSYNDAYYVLAAYFCGTHSAFVAQMNALASEYGALTSSFTDVTGLIAGSRTTAADMAKLAMEAYRSPTYMEICGCSNYDFDYDSWNRKTEVYQSTHFSVYNWNALISAHYNTNYYNSRCRGISAGSASEGNSVITVATDKTNSYLCVVLCGKEEKNDEGMTESYGYIIANRLISWAYKTFTYVEVINPETEICTVPVRVSDLTDEVHVRTNETLSAFLPKNVKVPGDIRVSVRLNEESLEAPVEENTFVGYATVFYGDRVLGTVHLYTVENVQRNGIVGGLEGIKALTRNRAVVAGGIFFVVTFAGWMITEYVIRRKKKQKWEKYFASKSTRR